MLKKAYRSRILIALFLFLCCAGALGARIYHLQYLQNPFWAEKADNYHVNYDSRQPSRGNFYTTNEQILAASTTVDAAYVDPQLIADEFKPAVAQGLADILGVSQATIENILNGSGRGLPLRPRQVTEYQAEKIRDLAVQLDLHEQTLFFKKESKRNYPMGELAAHILGYTKSDDYGDNIGVAGLERFYDEQIKGSLQRQRSRRTQYKGRDLIPFSDSTIQATFGNDLILTIDENIQHVAQKALLSAVAQHQATGGVIIVQRTKTGEILAMSNVPTYDPNRLTYAIEIQKRNRAVTDMIEPGSVMKIFTVAALFNEGLAEPEDIYDGMGGILRLKGRVIKDAPGHKLNQTTLYEGFTFSSNTVLVQAGLLLKPQQFYNYLNRFGFGQKTGIDLPGEVNGLLKSPGKWKEPTRQSIPMGYEMTATAIQIVTAVSAVANNGVLMKPQVVREIRDARGRTIQTFQPVKVRRVISTLTAKKVLNMMEGVVIEKGGTGEMAQLKGYRVAGKTGTTHKYDAENKGYYEDKYISSFVGVAPADDPEITIFCYIDDPENKKYGGEVAAPVFKAVAASALRTLNVKPATVVDDSDDYELVLDKYRQQAEKAVSLDEEITPGSMPSLRGLTMREAAVRMAPLGVQLEFVGSGIAVKQSPEAKTKLQPNQLCQVEFKPTGEQRK